MGKINNELNSFFQDNQEFADLINLYIYHGEKVVLPGDLMNESPVFYPEDHKGKKHELRNDVCKWHKSGLFYRLLCLENESKVSYIMPVRTMNYEVGRYIEQIQSIASAHNKMNDYRDWSERSSGFARGDRLHPVITLILYWSQESWDGATSLMELLDLSEADEELKDYIQDYKINLVNMSELTNTNRGEGQLKYILKLLGLELDKKEMLRVVSENQAYQGLKPETAKVLSVLLRSPELEKYIENNYNKGKETVNMCKALEDMTNEAEERGKLEGKLEVINSLMQKLDVDLEKACDLIGISVEEYQRAEMNRV